MDFGAFKIGGVEVILLVLGIVEAAKRFGVQGKASEGFALGLGFVFVALAATLQRELIPAGAVVYVEIVVIGLGGALAATGIYDLIKKGRASPEG